MKGTAVGFKWAIPLEDVARTSDDKWLVKVDDSWFELEYDAPIAAYMDSDGHITVLTEADDAPATTQAIEEGCDCAQPCICGDEEE